MKWIMLLIIGFAQANATASQEAPMQPVQYKTEKVDGLNIFYREAGDKNHPTIVLLHGFPSSSHMFRELIPRLSPHFHVIAPDYPGFGYSDIPSPEKFEYNFEHLSQVIEKFLKQTGNTKFFVYMHDYGGPVGFRIAVRNPSWIQGLIIQNANAYDEGVSELLKTLLQPIWENRTAKTEAVVLKMFEPEGTLFQYQHGARQKEKMNPDAWTLDQTLLDRPGNKLIQLELQAVYYTNPASYPAWHQYFQTYQPPTLVVWGENDPVFSKPGALAYKKDLKDIEMHFYNTGHFALEEDGVAIAERIIDFVQRKAK